MINENPVVGSFESFPTFAPKIFDEPDFCEIDFATLKSDSIEYVFDAGIKGKACDKVTVCATLFDSTIKIGDVKM